MAPLLSSGAIYDALRALDGLLDEAEANGDLMVLRAAVSTVKRMRDGALERRGGAKRLKREEEENGWVLATRAAGDETPAWSPCTPGYSPCSPPRSPARADDE